MYVVCNGATGTCHHVESQEKIIVTIIVPGSLVPRLLPSFLSHIYCTEQG